MAKFTGPVIVGPWMSDVTAATIDVSGTATFIGDLALTGHAIVSGSGVFTDRIQVGAAGARGTVELVQRTTVDVQSTGAAAITVNLPSGSDITDLIFDLETQFTASASAQDAELIVYLGSTPTAAGTIIECAVTSSGRYHLLSHLEGIVAYDASLLRNVTATVHAHLTAKNIASSYTGTGQGMLTIKYVVN